MAVLCCRYCRSSVRVLLVMAPMCAVDYGALLSRGSDSIARGVLCEAHIV